MTARKVFLASAVLALAGLASAPATAQTCTCETAGRSVCSVQGFRISLVNFQVDQNAGTSLWDYRVCSETGTDCAPAKDLSHVDIDLPGLGSCLTPSQAISVTQVGGVAQALLACGVDSKDPSCDIFGTPGTDFVAKCDVAGGNLDPGECVTLRLSIAGEQPGLGAGVASTVTKAGPECGADCILGPSCEACITPPPDACLTRTAGFWGTHPRITAAFLPVTVCGRPITTTAAGSCESSAEAMCVAPGRESRTNRAYAQLVRQLTAAKLNLAASAALGGGCGSAIEARIAACEALCGASHEAISASGCIEDIAEFNESLDSLPTTPAPFDHPGPAEPRQCQLASGNSLVLGQGACSQ